MVENYPTSLRVLVLVENDISPELQQQINDLLSNGDDDDDREAPPSPQGSTHGFALQPVREKPHHHHHPTWLPHSSKG